MSFIKTTENKVKCPKTAREMKRGLKLGAFLVLMASANGFGSGIDSGSRLGNSLSFGAFGPPSHQSSRGYSFESTGQDQRPPENVRYEITPSQETWQSDSTDEPVQQYFFQPETEEEPEVEPERGWKGYLREKGPSQVIVEIEVVHELSPLSDEVWGLIMGTGDPKSANARLGNGREAVAVDKHVVEIPKTQIDTNRQVVESIPEEPVSIHREPDEEESPILDDAAESYQQLMELFSRPVFATPTNEFGDADSMLSFRTPQNQPVSQLREGSSARFEIRR